MLSNAQQCLAMLSNAQQCLALVPKNGCAIVSGLNSLLGWLGAHEVTFLTWKMSLDITMKVGLLNKFLSNGGH